LNSRETGILKKSICPGFSGIPDPSFLGIQENWQKVWENPWNILSRDSQQTPLKRGPCQIKLMDKWLFLIPFEVVPRIYTI